jgi:hypothetical protein
MLLLLVPFIGLLSGATACRAGGSSAPGLEELYAGAMARHQQIESAARDLETRVPPPGMDRTTWSRYVDAGRRRLAALHAESSRVLARYSSHVHAPPRWPDGSGAAGGSFWSRLKDDIFGRDFDWRRMLAAAGGGGLGYFLGSRFGGRTGGMIGAAAGAFAGDALARWLIERKGNERQASPPSGEAATKPPFPFPLPPPGASVVQVPPLSLAVQRAPAPPEPLPQPPLGLEPAPDDPARAWWAMRRDHSNLSATLSGGPGKGSVAAYEQYRQTQSGFKGLQQRLVPPGPPPLAR